MGRTDGRRENVRKENNPIRLVTNRNRRRPYDTRRPLERRPTHSNERAPLQAARRMPEYNLNIEPIEVVGVMKSMGNAVRWPAKIKNNKAPHDKSKWCEFHIDHGHNTADCIALRIKVTELLKRGHLRELLTEKGKDTIASNHCIAIPPKDPTPEGMCNVISGDSEVSRVSYSIAKRYTREATNISAPPTPNFVQGPSDQTIQFVDNESQALAYPHHDALVITLLFANILVKRILVDGGSSANIIFLEALRVMGIDERNINRRSTILVEFSS